MLTLMSCGTVVQHRIESSRGWAHGRIATMDPWCIPGIGLLRASATRSLAVRHVLKKLEQTIGIKTKKKVALPVFFSCRTFS